ncbi:MAG: GrpB family protein [Lachnospiraceae bacterium]|nr:GrpB family protein [Lachnospiraceae bacterium]
MNKKLSEMSLKELWQLFPVFLTENQTNWREWYSEEEILLKQAIPQAVRISHIGSTAVGFIWAKPIIDILVEVPKQSQLLNYKDLILNSGYICMDQQINRISFNKGYTENGFDEKVFHLHLRYIGDNNELYFRDYLIGHPHIAGEYEKMKLKLWKEYEYNRDGYTNAKTEFVQKYTEKARLLYRDRY